MTDTIGTQERRAEAWRDGWFELAVENERLRAVVEAARRYTSAQRMNSKDSYQMLQDMVAALAALDQVRAPQQEEAQPAQ